MSIGALCILGKYHVNNIFYIRHSLHLVVEVNKWPKSAYEMLNVDIIDCYYRFYMLGGTVNFCLDINRNSQKERNKQKNVMQKRKLVNVHSFVLAGTILTNTCLLSFSICIHSLVHSWHVVLSHGTDRLTNPTTYDAMNRTNNSNQIFTNTDAVSWKYNCKHSFIFR